MFPALRSAASAVCSFVQRPVATACRMYTTQYLNLRDEEGNTLFHQAVKSSGVSDCRRLLQMGLNANLPDNKGATPLDTAFKIMDQEKIRMLQGCGAMTSDEIIRLGSEIYQKKNGVFSSVELPYVYPKKQSGNNQTFAMKEAIEKTITDLESQRDESKNRLLISQLEKIGTVHVYKEDNPMVFYRNLPPGVYILIVPNWNSRVRFDTFRAFDHLELSVLHDQLLYEFIGPVETGWDNMYVALLKKG